MPSDRHDPYDSLTGAYKAAVRESPLSRAEVFTFDRLAGDVAGLAVLDLGCGEGFYTRRLRRAGAAAVVGVDASAGMVRAARGREAEQPLGIHYLLGDAADLGVLGAFDLVVAAFLLNHADSPVALGALCRAAARNLRPGGRFVALNNNLELPLESYHLLRRYGRRHSAAGPLREGTPITVTLDGEGGACSVVDYYLSRETYERALREAGLSGIRWSRPAVAPGDLRERGAEYWRDFLENPPFVGIEAARGGGVR